MKRLGSYLIDNKICDESSLNSALEKQKGLKKNSIFKPIGAILAESGCVAAKDLDHALSIMHFERVSASTLFKGISRDAIKKTLSMAEHKVLPENESVYSEGDSADSFFIIVSGRIKVFLKCQDGTDKMLAVLQAGDCFGELSFFTGEPHRTSTETIEPTSLLALSRMHFNKLCTENTEVSMALIKGFASRLLLKDIEIDKASKKEKAYQKFVSEQDELSLPELIGQTRIINQLRERIEKAAFNEKPVLIKGEPGTERLVVAGNIHKISPFASAPFLSMDAENIALEGYGAIVEADSGTLQLEMAQSSILFGYEDKAFSFSKARGLGLLQICRQGSVVIRNIDKLTKGVQEKLLDYLRNGTFLTVGGRNPITSSARIIATTSEDLEAFAEEGRFDRDLLELLQANQLTVPPIKKRKSDLRLLVDFIIIMECFKTPDRKLIKGVSPGAYQRIMEYDWPGNMDELQIVIRRAINLTHSDYLMPEDIFIGMAPPEGKYTINLLQFDQVKNFFKNKSFRVGLQMVIAAFFSLILIMSFAGSQSPDKNVALILVWGMWEPMLVISWFFAARFWCSVCPMGAASDLLSRFGKKKLKVPAFIVDYGLYFSAAGLAAIILAEVITQMPYSPIATGFLLISIAFFALLSGLLFERRVWCRYLCPLGMLGAMFSGCSVVEWRANSSICNSTCKDNKCYKGDEETRGCPLYQGPFSLRSNQNCILCGNCVKLCTNESPAFNIRIPGHELWASLKPEKVTTVFMPVVLGAQVLRALEHSGILQRFFAGFEAKGMIYTVLLVLFIVVSFAFTQISGIMAFGKLKNSSIVRGDLFIHAIIPLSFVFEMGYQLNPLLSSFGQFFPTLGRQFGLHWEFLYFADRVGSITLWQVLLVLTGMAASTAFLKVIIRNHQEEEGGFLRYRRLRYLPIILLGGIYIGMFLVN